MSYVVLARKYRPKRFEEVVGQEPIAQTLRNAIASSRVAHAYLFAGPRGVGKTSMARILAMALNCSSSDAATTDPCGKCASCSGIFIGEDVDVREIDGASNRGVDDVRALRDNAGYHPAHSRYKVYIIDEVHMLTKEAFNALLKTLEEPPGHVKFIFATTEPHKLPETIHSRCQRFDFRNISTADIVKRLEQICEAEKVKTTDEVLVQIARRARGGMRDSQSLLDQVIAYSSDEVTPEAVAFVLGRTYEGEIDRLLEAFRSKDPAGTLRVVDTLVAEGQDLTEFLTQLIEVLRTLMVVKACGTDGKLLDLPAERIAKLAELSKAFSMDSILYMLQVTTDADRKARTAVEKRIVIETTMVKLASMEDLKPLAEILERLKDAGMPDTSRARVPTRPGAATPPGRPTERKAGAAEPEPAPVERAVEPEETSTEEEAASESDETPVVTASGPLGEVQAAWPRLLALLKTRHHRSLAAFLKDARVTALADDEVTVTFPTGYSFHVQRLNERDNLDKVEQGLSEVIGRRMRVRAMANDKEGVSSPPDSGSADRKDSSTGPGSRKQTQRPEVRRAVDIFGGRVMEDEP